MRSVVIASLSVVASLLALMNLFLTSGYTGRVPQGSDAMGLIVPLYATVASGLCLVAATWLAVGAGRLAWIDPRPTVATLVALLVAFGVGAMIVCGFLAWAGNLGRWVAPVAVIGAGIAPLALTAILLMSHAAAVGQPATPPVPRLFAALLAPVAGVGLSMGVYMVAGALRKMAAQAESTAAAAAESEAKWARQRNRTQAEAAREDMASYSTDAPLWTVIGRLPETDNPEARGIVIERALAVPNLNDELAATLVSHYPRYRFGSLLFIQHVDTARRESSWSALVAQSIDSTAAEIKTLPDWFVPDATRNPLPVQHVQAIADVAALFPQSAALQPAITRLKDAIAGSPAGSARDSALKILTKDSGE